ncbi:MAG: tRNA epoxyqueuosine(34) reductase QueG [Planctomycetia bacterium]
MADGAILDDLRRETAAAGFALLGVARPTVGLGMAGFDAWIAAGFHGEMDYLPSARNERSDPRSVDPAVRSVVMRAAPYRTVEPTPPAVGAGRISRYAWGGDYHYVLKDRLKDARRRLRSRHEGFWFRIAIDSTPFMERPYAAAAGLGWIGKNTLLLNRSLGSWFFLVGLLVNVELPVDDETETDHCGTCTACLDACPTNAFVAPGRLDARRCISYLTIELDGPIPNDLRLSMGDWLFGCDVCQDVCPWNRKPKPTPDPAFHPLPGADPVSLAEVFDMDDAEFRRRFRDTPVFRAGRVGLQRNAAVVAGNQRCVDLLPRLQILTESSNTILADAARWAIDRIVGSLNTDDVAHGEGRATGLD